MWAKRPAGRASGPGLSRKGRPGATIVHGLWDENAKGEDPAGGPPHGVPGVPCQTAMKLGIALLVGLLGSVAILPATQPACADSLRVGGTGSVTEVLRALAPVVRTETGIVLEIVPNLGSTGAFAAVADGKLGLAFGGRALRDREKARGLEVDGVLRTPFGFVTSRPGPDRLGKEDVVRIHRAANPTWPDGMPVLLALRPADESDNEVLTTLFPGMAEALAHLRKRRDIPIAGTDQENADYAERTKGSLAAASFSQITSERRNLRFVAIDGVAPDLRAYRDGSYRYGKLFHLVVPATPSAEARTLARFLASPAAQPCLEALGLVAGAR